MQTVTTTVKRALDDHSQSIDDLHRKLAGMPGINQSKLRDVIEKYKASTLQLHEDVLGCMN